MATRLTSTSLSHPHLDVLMANQQVKTESSPVSESSSYPEVSPSAEFLQQPHNNQHTPSQVKMESCTSEVVNKCQQVPSQHRPLLPPPMGPQIPHHPSAASMLMLHSMLALQQNYYQNMVNSNGPRPHPLPPPPPLLRTRLLPFNSATAPFPFLNIPPSAHPKLHTIPNSSPQHHMSPSFLPPSSSAPTSIPNILSHLHHTQHPNNSSVSTASSTEPGTQPMTASLNHHSNNDVGPVAPSSVAQPAFWMPGSPFFRPFQPFPSQAYLRADPKPNYSYIGLIAKAILSTKEKKMILSDIYKWIENNYTYFEGRGQGWRNSIRHNLSLNDCFIKVGRSANGKGHYWGIHPANLEDFKRGDFRRRRAQRKVRRALGLACVDDDDTPSPSPTDNKSFDWPSPSLGVGEGMPPPPPPPGAMIFGPAGLHSALLGPGAFLQNRSGMAAIGRQGPHSGDDNMFPSAGCHLPRASTPSTSNVTTAPNVFHRSFASFMAAGSGDDKPGYPPMPMVLGPQGLPSHPDLALLRLLPISQQRATFPEAAITSPVPQVQHEKAPEVTCKKVGGFSISCLLSSSDSEGGKDVAGQSVYFSSSTSSSMSSSGRSASGGFLLQQPQSGSVEPALTTSSDEEVVMMEEEDTVPNLQRLHANNNHDADK